MKVIQKHVVRTKFNVYVFIISKQTSRIFHHELLNLKTKLDIIYMRPISS